MAIDLDFFEKDKEPNYTFKKTFENPYKELIEAQEKFEKDSFIIPEAFIKDHNFPTE